MAEVSQVNPLLVDFIRQQIGNAIINDNSEQARPESLDLGQRSRPGETRNPFVITCDSWARDGRYIILWCNPSNWQWTMHQRGTIQPTRYGRVFHIWRDIKRPTYYDEPSVTITFQSGNIIPIRSNKIPASGNSTQFVSQQTNAPSNVFQQGITIIPPGILNFYEFLEMKDERKFLDDGSPNYVTIIASTPVFPQLVLKGYFNPDAFSWQETADDPNSIDWSDTFTVVQTFPRFNSSSVLRSVFEQMSGKSQVNRVLVDQTGLRRDANGNIILGSDGRASTSARTPPNLADRASSANSNPGANALGNTLADSSARGAEITNLQSIPPDRRTPAQQSRLNQLVGADSSNSSNPLTSDVVNSDQNSGVPIIP